MAGIAFASC